jgi:predicted N-acyltransferase
MTFISDLSTVSSNLKINLSEKAISNPFENIEYFQCLEQSGCTSKDSGWIPNHIVQHSSSGDLFIPTYQKMNSYGEFIFDYVWANAFTQHGVQYYPKLLSAIPFTPCHSNKLLGNIELLDEAINETIDFMAAKNIQTWHILFPSDSDLTHLEPYTFIKRYGYRFVWKNYDYESFEDYLGKFKSRQRKNIKKERQSITDANIDFEIIESTDINEEHWKIFFHFYCQTYLDRGQAPYLNIELFKAINAFQNKMRPIIFFAKHHNEYVGASLCFRGKDTLFGRHWGSNVLLKNLHFEACYYQGIQYCIENKIPYFDPGIQGEHKLRRGFEVAKKSSLHMILNKDFRVAIEKFCKEEEQHIDSYIESCKAYTPFSNACRI